MPAGQTATETIPWPVKNGDYVIHALVDPDNAVKEQSEVNNLATRQIAYANGRFVNSRAADKVTVPEGIPKQTERVRREYAVTPGANVSELSIDDVRADEARLQAACLNNVKQMGLAFKKVAIDSKGHLWPLLSNEPGRLMFVWGGSDEALKQETVLTTEYLTDVRMASCPTRGQHTDPPDDRDYVYLGYVVKSDKDVEAFARAYRRRLAEGGDFQKDLQISEEHKTILRIREGVERFYITDINDPNARGRAQSEIPTLIEWPDKHEVDGQQGGNVLYMDGHIEFVPYPGKWPMTEKTVSILCDLAGREPIE